MKKKFLNKIFSNSNKMSQIIDKLRLALKLQDSSNTIVLNNVSIKKLLENIISDLKVKYKNQDINILGEDKEIKDDLVLLLIVISNFIENFCYYFNCI